MVPLPSAVTHVCGPGKMYILPLTGFAVTFGKDIGVHTTFDTGFGKYPLHTDLDMGFSETSSASSDSPHTGCDADLSDPWDKDSLGMLFTKQGVMHGKSPGLTTHRSTAMDIDFCNLMSPNM